MSSFYSRRVLDSDTSAMTSASFVQVGDEPLIVVAAFIIPSVTSTIRLGYMRNLRMGLWAMDISPGRALYPGNGTKGEWGLV
ncbi:hypothetical protein GGS24DRAFT_506646 [Hypoxylon argillaceum]|nr:hypothetical protein GGS24DRAFT_506646 [Hypoxylon argillaceum]